MVSYLLDEQIKELSDKIRERLDDCRDDGRGNVITSELMLARRFLIKTRERIKTL